MDRAPNPTSHNVDTRRRVPMRLHARAKPWLIGAAALVLLAWAGHWLFLRWTHVYVDDARIDGEVVTIASRVSGWITELAVIEGDEVKAGQLLAKIDSRDSALQREALLSRLQALEGQMGVMRAPTG